jgi:septum formation protein
MLSDKLKDFKLILASASPRRKKLMEEMALDFEVITKTVKEIYPKSYSPEEVVLHLCELKSAAFSNSELLPNKLIITSDTVVAIDDEILGKPISRKNAVDILKKLSGREHKVITGVCLRTAVKKHSFTVTTNVFFKELSEAEINFYIINYLPFDKAGAYGIQEWIGHVAIEKIEGSYFNVMGLPTHKLYQELIKFVD